MREVPEMCSKFAFPRTDGLPCYTIDSIESTCGCFSSGCREIAGVKIDLTSCCFSSRKESPFLVFLLRSSQHVKIMDHDAKQIRTTKMPPNIPRTISASIPAGPSSPSIVDTVAEPSPGLDSLSPLQDRKNTELKTNSAE